MNKAVARLLTLGIKLRTIWLAVLLGIAIGFYMALGWAYVVLKSPEVALSLIERVQG
jgi:hypothetical protein